MSGAAKAAHKAQGLSDELVAEHGISPDEYAQLLKELGREPTLTELGVFSVMWSEHCSYKSSRVWLKKLPTSGPQVIQGPGENAGVVDLGDGQAAVFKMESHNHPSYIEPYQGAATGVGGIMRDVFTMGARPVANMNALRFGSADHAKTRHLVAGVVSGIGDYGNCMGVPTVGGETNFDPRYNDNILVNAMSVGLVDADRIFNSAAKGVGLPGGLCRLQDRPRRHSRRHHGVGRVRRGFGRKAPDRAGRRPVHREAAAGSLPRTDGRGRHCRHSGHGRGGAHLVVRGDGRQRRRRHRPRSRPCAVPRGGHDRLRDAAVGKPGAHADGAEARRREAIAERDLREMGARFRRDRRDHRYRPSSSCATTAWSRPIFPLAALADAAPIYERPWVKRREAPVIAAEDVPAPDSTSARSNA